MNKQWMHWRSFTATESIGAAQDIARPVIEQAMMEAVETERAELRGFFTKLSERLRAIGDDLVGMEKQLGTKLAAPKIAADELRAFAELADVLNRVLTDVDGDPDAMRRYLIGAMEMFDAPRFVSVGGVDDTCEFRVKRDLWATWIDGVRYELERTASPV